jgi:hypothetical protein
LRKQVHRSVGCESDFIDRWIGESRFIVRRESGWTAQKLEQGGSSGDTRAKLLDDNTLKMSARSIASSRIVRCESARALRRQCARSDCRERSRTAAERSERVPVKRYRSIAIHTNEQTSLSPQDERDERKGNQTRSIYVPARDRSRRLLERVNFLLLGSKGLERRRMGTGTWTCDHGSPDDREIERWIRCNLVERLGCIPARKTWSHHARGFDHRGTTAKSRVSRRFAAVKSGEPWEHRARGCEIVDRKVDDARKNEGDVSRATIGAAAASKDVRTGNEGCVPRARLWSRARTPKGVGEREQSNARFVRIRGHELVHVLSGACART